MTRTKAYKMDTDFIADLDDASNCYGVFGNNSGFCYTLVCDESEAEKTAEQMYKTKTKGDES